MQNVCLANSRFDNVVRRSNAIGWHFYKAPNAINFLFDVLHY